MDNEKEITHIDLFSGLGAFTLAGEWAGFRTIVFCEKEEFCQKVLKKHWPEIPIIEEIRDFDGTKWRGTTLLTGGFPCQPFSIAGQRRGKEDDRYLWPEMLRVINEAKPHWILAENVPGIFRMALDTVLADLEGEGYTTGTFIIPACGLNAPHRRNRVWIVANTRCSYGEGTKNKGKFKRPIFHEKNASLPERSVKDAESGDAQNTIGTRAGNQDRKIDDQKRRVSQDRRENIRQKDGTISPSGSTSTNSNASDSNRFNGNDARFGSGEIPQQKKTKIQRSNNSYAPDSSQSRLQIGEMLGQNIQQERPTIIRNAWQENWYEVATRFCRVDDGISDRIHRLKALGNAIVPQIAYEILKNIAWIENEKVAS